MRSVFDYLDYREILRDAFEERKREHPLFSLRMLAQRLGVEPALTLRILHGHAQLPVQSLPEAISFLGLTDRAAEYFIALSAYARSTNGKERGRHLEEAIALREVAQRKLVDHELDYYRHWYVVAVRSLVEVMDGRMDPVEIASRLSPPVSSEDVSKALDLLLELGLVRRTAPDRFALSEPHLSAGGPHRTAAVRSFQRQVLSLASESLERFPEFQRDVSTPTFAMDEDCFREVGGMLRETRRLIQLRIEQSRQPDRVLQLAIAFFPLAPSTSRPGDGHPGGQPE
ncbi:MAG TPA: TIGR02147 family protein [Fibrobacteria bacterium]|nr:TIGR02147 family protein [Fibrobacteria bacterium]HOX52280.1 TIGR02147 family protein [Fibrobacteria bacterium]